MPRKSAIARAKAQSKAIAATQTGEQGAGAWLLLGTLSLLLLSAGELLLRNL